MAFLVTALFVLGGTVATSVTRPTLMASWTWVALLMTSTKLLVDAMSCINWYVGTKVFKKVEIMSSSDIGCFKLDVLYLH